MPVYRIQIVGLGKEKPVDDGKGREAREKNRRVEVTLFSADDTPRPSSDTISVGRAAENLIGSGPRVRRATGRNSAWQGYVNTYYGWWYSFLPQIN